MPKATSDATCEVRLSVEDAQALMDACEQQHFQVMSNATFNRIRTAVIRALKGEQEGGEVNSNTWAKFLEVRMQAIKELADDGRSIATILATLNLDPVQAQSLLETAREKESRRASGKAGR